jgi:hypothetical protein
MADKAAAGRSRRQGWVPRKLAGLGGNCGMALVVSHSPEPRRTHPLEAGREMEGSMNRASRDSGKRLGF